MYQKYQVPITVLARGEVLAVYPSRIGSSVHDANLPSVCLSGKLDVFPPNKKLTSSLHYQYKG